MSDTPRLMPRKSGERVTGSVYHTDKACQRLKGTDVVEVNDQTVELLNVKLCTECKRRADSDVTPRIIAALESLDPDGALDGSRDQQAHDLALVLDNQGFEVRPKRKPRKKAASKPKG